MFLKARKAFVVLGLQDKQWSVRAVCTSDDKAREFCTDDPDDHYIEVTLDREIPEDTNPIYP